MSEDADLVRIDADAVHWYGEGRFFTQLPGDRFLAWEASGVEAIPSTAQLVQIVRPGEPTPTMLRRQHGRVPARRAAGGGTMSRTAEEAVLLAVMNEDEAEALERLREFLPGELRAFERQARRLLFLVDLVQHDGFPS